MRFNVLILFTFFVTYSGNTTAQVIVSELDEHHTQLDFGYQVMMIYFNIRPADEQFHSRTAGVNLTNVQRSQYANLVKDEILKLPRTFVSRYVIDNIFFLAITVENHIGYHSDDLIVIESREPDDSKKRILFHEIAHEVVVKSDWKKEYKELEAFFEANRRNTNDLEYASFPDIYETGHSSPYGRKSSEEEFCEIFADLMVPRKQSPLIEYVRQHPDSVLAIKVKKVIGFFQKNFVSEFNLDYFSNLGHGDPIARLGR